MRSLNTGSVVPSSSPKSLSNEALLRSTQSLVAEERKLTTEILWHLHEIQVRRLYAEKGYASLFEYAVQDLGYSEAAAGRRIAAMRLLADVPEIEPALQQGSISLSTLSTIQSFIQRKDSNNKNRQVSKQEKKELVLSLQGKSRRECEKHLVALDPAAATPKERERVVSPTQTEIRFIADDELMQKLKNIKELDAHVLSHPSYLDLFHRIADLALNELDPMAALKKTNSRRPRKVPKALSTPLPQTENTSTSPPEAVSNTTPPAESKNKIAEVCQASDSISPKKTTSRYISASLKRDVWMRDQGHCSYISLDGKRCGSRFALQMDHKTPVAWGGKSELSNLQLLCREHNRQKAILQLGPSAMRSYLR